MKSFQKNVNESISISKKEVTVREYGTALNVKNAVFLPLNTNDI